MILFIPIALLLMCVMSCYSKSGANVLPYECILPSDSGHHCRHSRTSWYFNVKQGQCAKFRYNGCGGNQNRFDSYSECRRKCSCHAEINQGIYCSEKYVLRYYWETSSKMCREFWFSGCKGNENRYRTLRQCKRVCD